VCKIGLKQNLWLSSGSWAIVALLDSCKTCGSQVGSGITCGSLVGSGKICGSPDGSGKTCGSQVNHGELVALPWVLVKLVALLYV
jgi:hypothetical protein